MEKQLIQAVRKLAADSPDCVYQKPGPDEPAPWGCSPGGNGCSYVRGICSNGSRGCIIGQAFAAIGHPLGDLPGAVETLNTDGHLPFILSDEAEAWIGRVQEEQDNGTVWGECVRRADIDCPLPVYSEPIFG